MNGTRPKMSRAEQVRFDAWLGPAPFDAYAQDVYDCWVPSDPTENAAYWRWWVS